MMRGSVLVAVTGAAVVLGLAAGGAGAAGFQIREQSTAALGNAMAGASASAQDVTYMAYNPASIGLVDGSQIAALASGIFVSFDIKDTEARSVLGADVTGGGDDNGGETALVPSLAAKWRVNDQVDLGLAVTAPWGLRTDYDENWAGRYHGLESDLLTVNIQPVISLKPTERLTVAGGLQIQYIDATLSNAVDFGTIGTATAAAVPGLGALLPPATAPGQNDGFAEVTGDDWGLGYVFGLIYEFTPGTRAGFAYRSAISHRLEGDATFELDDDGVGAVISAATGQFVDTGGAAEVTIPETASFGLHHQLSPRWAVLAEASWTNWARFEELVVEFDNPAQADSVTTEQWESTWMYALGLNFMPTPAWTLRTGVGFDESPVPDETRTPRIPGNDRTWLGVGATWKPSSRLSVSASFVHIFVKDSTIDLEAQGENQFRGSLDADMKGRAEVVSAQVDWRF